MRISKNYGGKQLDKNRNFFEVWLLLIQWAYEFTVLLTSPVTRAFGSHELGYASVLLLLPSLFILRWSNHKGFTFIGALFQFRKDLMRYRLINFEEGESPLYINSTNLAT